MSSDLAKRLNAHSSTVPKGQLRDDLRTAADELERLSAPTDVADRREAIVRQVLDLICAAMCKTAGAVSLDPDPWVRELASQIAALIEGPLIEGFVASGPKECAASPTGRHQVDTSMESGPDNCFYCEKPMPRFARPTGES